MSLFLLGAALPPLQLSAFQLVDLEALRPCKATEELRKTQAHIRLSLCRAGKKTQKLVRLAHRVPTASQLLSPEVGSNALSLADLEIAIRILPEWEMKGIRL